MTRMLALFRRPDPAPWTCTVCGMSTLTRNPHRAFMAHQTHCTWRTR